jgi:CheY-like chemotaxis protein
MKRRVLAAVPDMFFAAKIRGAAEVSGVALAFARSVEAAVEKALDEPPALVVADLQAQGCDPFALAARFKSDERLRAIPLVGFYSHVEDSLRRRAAESGFDRVLPRSAFASRLPEILKGEL